MPSPEYTIDRPGPGLQAPRLRVAHFGPLPPSPSGIADYSAALLRVLARRCGFDLMVEPGRAVDADAIPPGARIREWSGWDVGARGDYDVALYQMGNHPIHAYVHAAICGRAGVTVLHDAVLHHFYAELYFAARRWPAYTRELLYSHGPEGLAAGERGAVIGVPEEPYRWPMLRRVVTISRVVIVHSEYARRAVLDADARARVEVVPLLALPRRRAGADRLEARRALGLGVEDFLVVVPGLATPEKRLEVILDAIFLLGQGRPGVELAIVGASDPNYDVATLIAERRLTNVVRQTGRVALDILESYLDAADVVVALRYPTAGETSGVVLRALDAGRPTIVSDTGWFAELPIDVCFRLGVGVGEATRLAELLDGLASDRALAEEVGARARAYVATAHGPDTVENLYLQALAYAAGRAST